MAGAEAAVHTLKTAASESIPTPHLTYMSTDDLTKWLRLDKDLNYKYLVPHIHSHNPPFRQLIATQSSTE